MNRAVSFFLQVGGLKKSWGRSQGGRDSFTYFISISMVRTIWLLHLVDEGAERSECQLWVARFYLTYNKCWDLISSHKFSAVANTAQTQFKISLIMALLTFHLLTFYAGLFGMTVGLEPTSSQLVFFFSFLTSRICLKLALRRSRLANIDFSLPTDF